MVVVAVGQHSYYQALLKGTNSYEDESVIDVKLSSHFYEVNKIGMFLVGDILVAIILGICGIASLQVNW